MDALGFTFLITSIVGGIFLGWTYTKSGKKWIDKL